MSFFDWLRQTVFGGARKRDVARLESTDGALDTVAETVDVSGAPLREGHRRRAWRDRRLLPKAKPPFSLPRWKRKRNPFLSTRDAARLFSRTLLTRNRRLRDLAPDVEQLQRLGLPVWKSEEDIVAALKLTVGQLRHFAIHRERERAPHYVTFAIPKRSGGERLIMAPKRRLKAIQRQLLALLVEKLPVTEHAHGFRRGRNVRTGAEAHVGKRTVVRLDLKDFFPSVTFARVRGYLIACGYGYLVASTLAVLMTEAVRQPVAVDGAIFHVPVGQRHCVQGAPTSPGLCNAIVAKLDRRLAGLARKFGLAYTRYADDLTFSGELDARSTGRFLHHAVAIIRAEGFSTNATKTRVLRRGSRQRVTGVIVNQVLGLSRTERRKLRATAHRLQKSRAAGQADTVAEHQFAGHLAYLSMLNPQQAAALRPPPPPVA